VGNTRQPFPNNIIPARALQPGLPGTAGGDSRPDSPLDVGNFDFVNTNVYDRYIWNLKFDHSFTQNNRVSFLVTKENEINDAQAAFPGPLGQGLQGFQKPDNWRFNHDLVIRPTLLVHSTYGYSRTRQLWDNPYQKGGASQFGFPGITGDSDAMPRVMFTGADNVDSVGRAGRQGCQRQPDQHHLSVQPDLELDQGQARVQVRRRRPAATDNV
jgi:hypothetical protein